MSLQMRSSGAFHDYVRSVFADEATRARLHATRMRWLRYVARQAATAAEQRWESEGGSTRREAVPARLQT
jgi:hypothetical protein